MIAPTLGREMHITDQTFTNDEIQLDGNRFEHCTFRGCRMIFKAEAPVGLVHCHFENVSWHFIGAASLASDFIKGMTEATGDYGKALLINTFPAIKDWIIPEIRERFSPSPADRGNENE